MNVVAVQVLTGKGPDIVSLYSPALGRDALGEPYTADIKVPAGLGSKYAETLFPDAELEVITKTDIPLEFGAKSDG